MSKLKILFSLLLVTVLTTQCDKQKSIERPIVKKRSYNEAANELIVQTVHRSDSTKCFCILELKSENYDKLSKTEKDDLKAALTKKLKLKKDDNVENLLKIADSFKWDEELLKKNNIKLYRYEALKKIGDRNKVAMEIYKSCPGGDSKIQRPILDKKCETAIIAIGVPFSCFAPMYGIYRFESGKWIPN